MLRIANGLALVAMIVTAFLLYSWNVSNRRLELDLRAAENKVEQIRSEITVLKADRAFLARPTRIEPAARALGLGPPLAKQFVRIEDVAHAPARRP